MNIDFSRTGHQIIFQSVRSVATIVGLGGMAVAFLEFSTGAFFVSTERLMQASDLLNGIIS
ncbi:MAG TPA: hypothetical protein PKI93_04310 [Alphaproteobacteria bacterium]|nr:hypothetical protein [Alphaproteobacteria bacterium]HNS44082.1 hypothetical protein [Alphaproteobacteria bacterium]